MLEKANGNHNLTDASAREQLFSTEAKMHTNQITQLDPKSGNHPDPHTIVQRAPTLADGLPGSGVPTEPDDLPDHLVLDLSQRLCVCCAHPIKRFGEDVCEVCR